MRTLKVCLVSGVLVFSLTGASSVIAQENADPPAAREPTPEPVVWVTGTATCPTANPGTSTVDDKGVRHFRDGVFTCTMDMSDPRVSGTHTTTSWSADVWGTGPGDWELVQWAEVRLENDGGTWEGRLAGVASLPRPGDIIASWYRGTGDYAGLSYFEQWTGPGPWTVQGLIFPGEPPAD